MFDLRKNRSNQGFTIVEMVVTLGVVAVITGLVTFSMARGVHERSVQYYAKEMTSYLRYLQFRAIETGDTYKLSMNSLNGEMVTSAKDGGSSRFKELKDPYGARLMRTEKFTVELERGDLYFFPDGNMTRNSILVHRGSETTAKIEIKNRIGTFGVSIYES